jgi:hypothetical protein
MSIREMSTRPVAKKSSTASVIHAGACAMRTGRLSRRSI